MTIPIRSLHVYPIKGCAAVDVDAIDIGDDGLIVGDRTAMLVDAATGRFLSQRQLPMLARVRPTWRTAGRLLVRLGGDELAVDRDACVGRRAVTVWDDTFDADDCGDAAAAWFEDRLGRPVRLVMLARPTTRVVDPYWTAGIPVVTSFADLAPALLTNVASLRQLNERRTASGRVAVPMARFRPNIVVDADPPFAEDAWQMLRTANGLITLRCIKPCARCQVTEIDQATGQVTDDDVLKTLAPFRTLPNARGTRGILFGQNVTFQSRAGGRVALGDELDASEHR